MRRTFRILLVALTVLTVSGIGPLALERACAVACHGGPEIAVSASDGCCDPGPLQADPGDPCDCCTHLRTTLAQLRVQVPAPPNRVERYFTAPPPLVPPAPPADILHVPLPPLVA